MINNGKKFEKNFKDSLDLENPDLFFYRFKDGTASWGNQQNEFVRFQAKNISDCMLFFKGNLFICELKAHKGKSLPLSCIRENQFQEMYKASFKKNVYPMIIIFFSEIEECYVIPIEFVNQIREEKKSKSISLLFCKQFGFKIDCRKLQTNYRYNIEDFLENFIKTT